MISEMTSLFNTDEDGCFFFESDHLALRGNKDYCDVLKTLVVLSAQREKLIKDYNKVVEIRKNVFGNIDDVIQKINNGEDLGIQLPDIAELPKIPVINFESYNVKIPENHLKAIYSQTATNSSSNKIEDELKKEREKYKSENYNSWSAEEQKKLEELLIKFPPELIERRRFQKIANELGTRSVAQVASRVQKYFLKLYKAGLPIPGRLPKNLDKRKKPFPHKHQRYNQYLWKPTTFFPNFDLPVTMDELDNIPGPSFSSNPPGDSRPSNYLLETDYYNTHEITGKTDAELKSQLLKRVKEEKLRELRTNNNYQHIGFKCDFCNSDPIVATRWNCMICPDSIDFCTDCVISQLYSNRCHPLIHPLAIYQDNENYSISHGDEASFTRNIKIENVDSESEDTNDGNTFEYDNNQSLIKDEIEEGLGTDEESRSNFDSDLY
ncbi:ZZ-type zinc finger-containing protein 3 [Diorhabda sublineata]|uniref:ZZ-type zinc finger-containing protein 3 n=1 Tax=Diorhabda sublineata TaxID=1163346 RepID=UPI0024E09F79|nr:ZZ-type zinc finger-containing protein 3 [Diorhabda sublineata]XP_056635376.1 ZZ-type zinc finger-containing protein 3 [Diorhabda sublineata]